MNTPYIDTKKLSHEEWLLNRKIGGTTSAKILGLHPYGTPLDAYNEILDPVGSQIEENARMIAGKKLENVVSDWYADETGNKVQLDNKIRIHPEFEFIRANVDRVILNNPNNEGTGILEVKTTNSFAQKYWNTEIPLHYYCQIQHYFNVTGYSWGDFAILVDGYKFETFTVYPDKEFIKMATEKLVHFWSNNILKRIPPEPINEEDVKRLYPIPEPGKLIECTSDAFKNYKELLDVRKEKKLLEEKESKLSERLKVELKDAEVLAFNGTPIATWKKSKDSEQFDKTAFQKSNPDMYSQFLKPKAGSRRFLLKEMK